MTSVDISENKDGGVLKLIKREGEGTAHPVKGDTVTVHYVGTLEDGSQFDSSRERGEKFTFNLGKGEVIKAWDIGVASMKRGEVCVLTCKPEYAYGESGSPPRIPANATLIFEVELFSWEGEDISPDHDKSIFRSLQHEGEKWDTPKEGSLVEINIKGYYQGKQFLAKDAKYLLGECSEHDLPEGVDKALKKFKKGEQSLISLKPKWGYGTSGKPAFNIPPFAELEFDIELKDFEKEKESWNMNLEEKLEDAEKCKLKGTEFFQHEKYKLAMSKYNRIVDLLQHENSAEGDAKVKRDQLYHAAQLNLALCYLKTNETAECIKRCEKVLDENKDNVKALYRRAQAYQAHGDYSEALVDFNRVLELEPANKAALLGIQQCKQHVKAQKDREKKTFANMFDKFAAQDIRAEMQTKKKKTTENKAQVNSAGGDHGKIENGTHVDEKVDEEMPTVDAAAAT